MLTIDLLNLTSEGLLVDREVSAASLRPDGVDAPLSGSVRVTGRLSDVSGQCLFRGTVSTIIGALCDRCLINFELPLEFEVVWLFEPGREEDNSRVTFDIEEDEEEVSDDDRAWYFEGNTLNLAPVLWEELVLNLPSKMICDADCAGLCPGCGVNLNEGPCVCTVQADENSNKGFGKLADLFPDLKPDDSKE
ncbi:MAG: DUF177 domain-containing protein [Candidatus Hydrogenedentes bacterium]|nr:DUF177 domain-containing protein [Candidatus Hydrogenedentota bacterium]